MLVERESVKEGAERGGGEWDKSSAHNFETVSRLPPSLPPNTLLLGGPTRRRRRKRRRRGRRKRKRRRRREIRNFFPSLLSRRHSDYANFF